MLLVDSSVVVKLESSLDNTMVEVQESNNVSFATASCGQRRLQLAKEAWKGQGISGNLSWMLTEEGWRDFLLTLWAFID